MGKASRDKGMRRERQIVALHTEIGIKAERVPLSGAAKFRNTESTDVDVYALDSDTPLVCEVKGRANGEGFKTLEAWLGEADALFLVRDRASPLVALPWSTWERLIRRARNVG